MYGPRFVSLADRFIAELSVLGTGQVPKEAEPRFEHLVRGLQHMQLKVSPSDLAQTLDMYRCLPCVAGMATGKVRRGRRVYGAVVEMRGHGARIQAQDGVRGVADPATSSHRQGQLRLVRVYVAKSHARPPRQR